jgi:hypothetical protein
MKIEYNNVYSHIVLTTYDRQRIIHEEYTCLRVAASAEAGHKKISFAEEYDKFIKHYQDTLKK